MKTKIYGIASLLATLSLLSATSLVHAAGVIPLSSGIKSQSYDIEWCSPRASALGFGSDCKSGTLKNVGGIATVVYNGTNFPAGDVSANLASLATTRTDKDLSSAASTLASIFNNSTNGAFSMEGEGVLTLNVTLLDYADNPSVYHLQYDIDKTAPQLTFNSITENSNTTYYGGPVNANFTVTKNDSSLLASAGTSYVNPDIASYAGNNTASPRAIHSRTNLNAFYFKDLDGTPFTVNTSYSDTYGTYLQATGTSSAPGGYAGNLVSGAKNFQLLDGSVSGGVPLTGLVSLTGAMTVALDTAKLTSNNLNGQAKYRLRLYDTTVDQTDVSNAGFRSGNYSETAFYVVRDNTAPNIGGNGLTSGTGSAIEQVLTFGDASSAYDTTAYSNGYTTTANGVSRFLEANANVPLTYQLNDTGITGQSATSGAGCLDFNLCNAGIEITNTKISIEDANDPSAYPIFQAFSDRFVNMGTNPKSFSKVDNDTVANGTYRKYEAKFASNVTNGLCDLVGNCIAPSLQFRVVANTISNATSNATVALGANARGDGKVIANGFDKYDLSYALRDSYDNKVVPVISVENGSLPIKGIETTIAFDNGLYGNQLGNGSGPKLGFASDLSSDNTVFTNSLNTAGTIIAREDATKTPDGIYGIALGSAVPTKSAYPYLVDTTRLRVTSLTNRSDLIAAPADMTYPKTGARMGYFPTTAVGFGGAGVSELASINSGGIGETGGFQNISVDAANYGKITLNSTNNVPFSTLAGRSVNFEFGSPLVYGLVGMKVLIDGQFSQHFKKLYTIDTSDKISGYNVYEKNLVAYNTNQDEQPGILDYVIRKEGDAGSTDINSGVRYTNNETTLSVFPNSDGSAHVYKSMNIKGASGSGFSAEMQMSSKPATVYDNSKLRTGFVSAVTYTSGPNTIQLPSVARNVTSSTGSTLSQYDMARNYFAGTYQVGTTSSGTTFGGGGCTDPSCDPLPVITTISNIAITGLTNQYNSLTLDASGSKANVNIKGELSRTEFLTNIKKNVALLSASFKPAGDTTPNVKKWCTGGTIGQTFLDAGNTGPSKDCTTTVNNEEISFIDGNTVLDCGTNNCHIDKLRAIIVRNGSLYIKSNITTLDSSGLQTIGQLLIGSIATDGLANINIDANDPDIDNANKSGWLFVDPKITNIDAFLVAQGPMVSYSDTDSKLYSKDLNTERSLRNQMHIMGSVLSLNNITGSRKTPLECPYIVENCDENTSQIFDLVYLRRFSTSSLSIFTDNPLDNATMVPYHPDGPNIAKRSGGLTGATLTPGPQELRYITDSDYQNFPMLIERDVRWNSTPSRLFQTNQ